jgi:putative nucleotidyltransferase with HDIG domain
MKSSLLLGKDRIRWLRALCSHAALAVSAECVLGATQGGVPLAARIARCLGLTLSLFIVHVVSMQCLSGYREREQKGHLLLVGLSIVGIFAASIGTLVSLALVNYGSQHHLWQGVSASSFIFCIPFAMPVLIVRSILGLHAGFVAALFQTLIMGEYFPMPGIAAALALSTSLVACVEFHRVRSRSAYLRAALKIGAVAVPFAFFSVALSPVTGVLDLGVRVFGCFIGGAISGIVAVGITPAIEYLFGYASDMRLIEMATLDHPLLKEVSVQAPGTWNHSMVIGMMVESAADAISANPVVCRVGAYFHDIGKTTKPLYFVENQNPGENRHDKLSPSMSALIIRSHVKDGVELARKHRLPKIIEDLIAQHHGTSKIEFFYEKARKEAEDAGHDPESVDKTVFSYPGPRPQTREAGLLMLADGIEAAARTLSDPSFDRIQGMVQKMINKVFASGELNECELTLRDLHVIAKCFTRVLTGIYHQRVAYAEPAEKTSSQAADAISSGEGPRGGEEDKAGRRVENLKRLGVE